MTVLEALGRITRVEVPAGAPPAARSAADVVATAAGAVVVVGEELNPAPAPGTFQVVAPAHSTRQGVRGLVPEVWEMRMRVRRAR